MNTLRPEERDRVLSRHELKRMLGGIEESLLQDQLAGFLGTICQARRECCADDVPDGIGIELSETDVRQVGHFNGGRLEKPSDQWAHGGIGGKGDTLRCQGDLYVPVDV